MYRIDFWTLWEKMRVRCFERTASKQVYYQGWNRSPAQVGCTRQVLGASTLGRPRGMGWRGKREGGLGWWTHVSPWLIHVNVWQKPPQYCKVIYLQLIKINGKNKKKEPLMFAELAQTAGRVVCWQVQGSAAWGPPYPIPKLGHLSCHLLPALYSEDRTIVRVRNAISSNLQPYPYFVLAAFIRFLLMQVGTRGDGPWRTWSSLLVSLMPSGHPSVRSGQGVPGWQGPNTSGITTNLNSRGQEIERVFKLRTLLPHKLALMWSE